jgi:hypothetical protein
MVNPYSSSQRQEQCGLSSSEGLYEMKIWQQQQQQ